MRNNSLDKTKLGKICYRIVKIAPTLKMNWLEEAAAGGDIGFPLCWGRVLTFDFPKTLT
jgi:hypothetical protein